MDNISHSTRSGPRGTRRTQTRRRMTFCRHAMHTSPDVDDEDDEVLDDEEFDEDADLDEDADDLDEDEDEDEDGEDETWQVVSS